MPVVRLARDELLAIDGQHVERFKTALRRGQWAGAYSLRDAPARAWYLPEDCVASHLVTALSEIYGGTLAAQLTSAFSGVLLTAIAQADASPNADALFAVVDFINADGQRAHHAFGARDTEADANAVKQIAAQGYVVVRAISVNVSLLVRAVRGSGARIGLDLSADFLPAPNSDAFAELMRPYEAVEAGLVEIKALKRRDAAAQRAGVRARAIAMGGSQLSSGNAASPKAA